MTNPRSHSAWQQTSALLYKNFALQRSQKANTVCQLLVPVILVSIVGLLQWLVDTQVTSASLLQTIDEFPNYSVSFGEPTGPGADILTVGYFHYEFDPSMVNATTVGYLDETGNGGGLLGKIPQQDVRLPLPYKLPFMASPPHHSVADLDETLINMYTYWRDTLNDTRQLGTPPRLTTDLWRRFFAEIPGWLRERRFDRFLPLGAFLFNRFELDSTKPDVDITLMPAGRYGGWRLPMFRNQSVIQQLYPEIDRKANMLNTLNNLLFREMSGSDDVLITTYFQGFSQKVVNSFDLASIAGFHLFGFAVSFLLPTFVSTIVLDKQEKCLIMMRMSGLKMPIYWFSNWIYQLIIFALVMICMCLAGLAFGMRLFTQTSPWLLLVVFGLWGNSLIAFSFLLSTAFNKAREASIISYFLVIIGVIVSNLLNGSVFLSENPPLWFLLYPPFAFYRCLFIVVEACINQQCMDLASVFDWSGANRVTGTVAQSQLGEILILMIFQALAMFILAWYLNEISPKEWGVRQSPLFCLRPAFAFCRGTGRGRRRHDYNSHDSLSVDDDNDDEESASLLKHDYLANQLDGDVLAERKAIICDYDNVVDQSTLVIRELTKQYSGADRPAVDSICLAIRRGECFGLLGLNGAGKTTLLSCLTGMLEPSSGTAVYNFGQEKLDMRQDMSTVQRRVGVCLQFDVFYPSLSCMEHLLFYCRLKGGISNYKQHSLELLNAVGLKDATNKLAKDLSGGMRRRLSMAVALVGNPQLLFLDECTTGLDPLTKQQVWQVFSEIRAARPSNNPLTVLMTTHYMEEADNLCSRVAIMTGGQLRCLGAPEYLKQKIGGAGYTLTIRLEEEAVEKTASNYNLLRLIHQSVTGEGDTQASRTLAKDQSIVGCGVRVSWKPDTSMGQCVDYEIHPFSRTGYFGPELGRLSLGPLFRKMNQLVASKTVVNVPDNSSDSTPRRLATVKDWALNAVSLEDVFVSTVKSTANFV